jgi:hypothetical protein
MARAEARAEAARLDRDAAIKEAYRAGESVTLIASVANLTRQQVHRIVHGDPTDASTP